MSVPITEEFYGSPNARIVIMSATGASPPCQYHLPGGELLLPINTAVSSDGMTTNAFAIPLRYVDLARRAGFETNSDLTNRLVQGPTSARPVSPADGTSYFDQTIGNVVIWSTLQAKWVAPIAWRGLGT